MPSADWVSKPETVAASRCQAQIRRCKTRAASAIRPAPRSLTHKHAGDVKAGTVAPIMPAMNVVPSVEIERLKTVGRVVVGSCVAYERFSAGGRVLIAGCVVVERHVTSGCVGESDCVKFERFATAGCVEAAGGVIIERIKTDCRVVGA